MNTVPSTSHQSKPGRHVGNPEECPVCIQNDEFKKHWGVDTYVPEGDPVRLPLDATITAIGLEITPEMLARHSRAQKETGDRLINDEPPSDNSAVGKWISTRKLLHLEAVAQRARDLIAVGMGEEPSLQSVYYAFCDGSLIGPGRAHSANCPWEALVTELKHLDNPGA